MKTLMVFFNSALVLLLCIHADAMFSKKQRYYEEKVKDPERRFRSNVAELFLDNQVSADRIMSVFEDAKLAGTKHISDLCSKTKSKTKKKFRKNAQRDLLRRLLKKISGLLYMLLPSGSSTQKHKPSNGQIALFYCHMR
jgi:hypothetical protein